ncbi:hypothetical protein JDV02_000647 [Purpureocillium takamizusanense]|uniref:HAUS augmin-like complex subunit 3 N-terminal domain-containing protein n=1 Tax=Purpureocillium takamizusanense TaxID=2060973 RepID=A0A9Q8Q776_9HYPO|nr:uncharacterized protein JDV02_000647 [Purpureocillium takamizusanense]UNI13961.1 hypothetical protein JDV02_000647 [Purpureocillium takamizusanense]
MDLVSPTSNKGYGSCPSAEALLLEAVRGSGLQLSRDDLRRALDNKDHGPELAEWAVTHLGSDTLLSADELSLYMTLDRSGQVDRLAAMYDLAEVQAVNEAELRAAIDELQRSTSTISKQTQTLRQQQEALSRLLKKQAENEAKRRDLAYARTRKAATERRRLANEIEQLSQTLLYRVTDLEQQAADTMPDLQAAVSDAFKTDDKLLSSLQKLGWELDKPDPDEAKTIEEMREGCMRLIKVTVETVRTKLDAIYLDTLADAERSGKTKPASPNEVTVLQEEVESLYSEILSVAQMSVEQQHLEPALVSITAQSGQSLSRTAAAVAYMDECLDHLLDRVDRLHSRVTARKSDQAATAAVTSTIRAESATQEFESPSQQVTRAPASPKRQPSPIRIRADAAGPHGQRRSSAVLDEAPLETLCTKLAISLDINDGTNERIASLAKLFADRSQKGSEVARGAQESFEATAKSQLHDARLAVQLLRDSILAESPFGQVTLVDPGIDESIAILQQEVSKAQERLSDVEGQILQSRGSTKREELIQRWGR